MNTDHIRRQIHLYTRRYILRAVCASLFRWFWISGLLYLFLILVEGMYWLPPLFRSLCLLLYLSGISFLFFKWPLKPLIWLLGIRKPFSEEEACLRIGKAIPHIQDKLINYLQLQSMSLEGVSAQLKDLSLKERFHLLLPFSFGVGVSMKSLGKWVPYLLGLLFLFGLLNIQWPSLLSHSSHRLFHPHKVYIPPAPFEFILQNQDLSGFRFEPFTIELQLKGKELPKRIFFVSAAQESEMLRSASVQGIFSHTINHLLDDFSFSFQADGFRSQDYFFQVKARPLLRKTTMKVKYPNYLRKESEIFAEIKDLSLPEGSLIEWTLETEHAEEISYHFDQTKPKLQKAKPSGNNLFSFQHQLKKSIRYEIILENKYSQNKESLFYKISSIADSPPSLYFRPIVDTVFHKHILLSGQVEDDYRVTRLALEYKRKKDIESFNIPIRSSSVVLFSLPWRIDSLNIKEEESLLYRLRAWDNDGLRGPKSSQSSWYRWGPSTWKEQQKQQEKTSKEIQALWKQTLSHSDQLENKWKNIQDKIRTQKKLGWRDKKEIMQSLEEHLKIQEEIKNLKEKYKLWKNQQDQAQLSPGEKEKAESLEKILDKLIDEKTEKLRQELNDLMQKKEAPMSEWQEKVEEFLQEESLLNQEMKRSSALLQKLREEFLTQQLLQRIEDLQDEQQKLLPTGIADETDKQNRLIEKVQELYPSFEKLEDFKKKNNPFIPVPPDWAEQLEQIDHSMKKALEKLEEKEEEKSWQEQAERQLNALREDIDKAHKKMESKELDSRIQLLKNLLQRIIHLSFEQEEILKSMKETKAHSPRYYKLSHQQINLEEAIQPTLDSLSVLSKKLTKIDKSFARQVQQLGLMAEKVSEALRKRDDYHVAIYQNKSLNLLNDIGNTLDEILDRIADSKNSGKGKKGQPNPSQAKGQKKNNPSLSERQKKLNQQIRELKRGKEQGKKVSPESLARALMEQERIREALRELFQKAENKSKKKSKLQQEIIEEMKKNEMDLARKKLNPTLINRLQKIQTRLLESENSESSQKESRKRKGEKARDYPFATPPSLEEEFLRKTQTEVDTLGRDTVPLREYYQKIFKNYLIQREQGKRVQPPLNR
ncbi:MAG: hypothetical protein OXB93_01190 [Cytophagales bacterium]|nr:hypothetical protein [Cytophagales bacterium]